VDNFGRKNTMYDVFGEIYFFTKGQALQTARPGLEKFKQKLLQLNLRTSRFL